MIKKLLCALACGLVPWAPAAVAANDFPTLDRVEYVLGCARDAHGPAQENIYKCTCMIDTIAQRISYDQYVAYSTSANALSIGGERGETMRAYGAGKEMASKFRALQADARKACLMS
ncbi:hypothetical protein [Azoarcus sp. KH32C]|uniref:hypothetical protein n=1 Tax=Azoarcus sp. KH32C TaxID=748247 RepID=UPI0002385DD4|nr:hypothetical protein [Azoarcus sp. KH32C]BAL27138.1 hypothetical protein AZKH_p0255 [Azoarcus sp. KH32C]